MASTALLTRIAACSPQPPGSDAPLLPVERGAQIYAQNCVPCHREGGEGVSTVYPALHGSAVLGDPVELAQWVLSQKRPASIPAGRYATQMPLFGWLKDEDTAALLSYIRSSFGNHAAPVAAAIVAESRPR